MSFAPLLSRVLPCFLLLAVAVFSPDYAESAQKEKKKPAAAKVFKKSGAVAKTGFLDKDWQKTFALIKDHDDPVAQKLVTWLYATQTDIPTDADALMDFANRNENWPRLSLFRNKVEENIASAAPAAEIIAWFEKNPPQTHDGIKAYMQALIGTGRKTDAQKALSAFWLDTALKKNEVAAIAGAYKGYFLATDHATRLDRLIWEGRYEEAEYMLAFVDANVRSLGVARMALAKSAPNAEKALAAVPASLQKNEGLVFERMRWRRRKDMDAGALEILAQAPPAQSRPDKWWSEINILARRAIEEGNYKKAYGIAIRNKLKPNPDHAADYASAQWLLGWLSLRYLHDTPEAYRRFDDMYRNVKSAVSRSRAAFWAARASDKLPDAATAKKWDEIAAFYPSTFYGQLSYVKLKGLPGKTALASKNATAEEVKAFDRNELARAIRLLHKVGLTRLADPFFAKLLADAKKASDYQLTARLAHAVGRRYYAVEANKQLQQELGFFLPDEGYPTLSPAPAAPPEKALVHAIIYRESMFDPGAASTAGARGLMQLMPGTAQMMAKKKGRTYSSAKLTDGQYNTALGSAYLDYLLDNYGDFYPMAIAAYNAGPGNVSKWIAEFGDPRKGHMDILDWIEHIPLYETRNYVQRVMETYFIYRVKFGEKPKIITDFMPQ